MSTFSVTGAGVQVVLDQYRSASVVFTVSNGTARATRGRAAVNSLEQADPHWFRITGDAERPFAANSAESFTVVITVPPNVPAGDYRFRLDVVATDNPDEDFSHGPTMTVSVPETVRAVPPPVGPKPFPRWILVAVALALVIGGVGIYLATRPTPDDGVVNPPDNPPPDSPPKAHADLQVTGLTVTKVGDDYQFAATVANNGDGAADGFNVVVQWDCPPGDPTISSGTTLGTFHLDGDDESTYQRTIPFGAGGTGCAGNELDNVTVIVDQNGAVDESDESNNSLDEGTVTLPG